MALRLVIFTLALVIVTYLFNSVVARRFKPIKLKPALLYITTVAMIGVFGEIFVDSVYAFFVGNPLWHYNILPVHHGYTSEYAVVLWGIFGFYLYLMHDSLQKWSISRRRHLSLIFAFEALVLEAIVVLTSKPFLGEYVYYYYPGDLWHISTVQNFPFYLICGYAIVSAIRRFKADPRFFIIFNTWLTSVLIFFT